MAARRFLWHLNTVAKPLRSASLLRCYSKSKPSLQQPISANCYVDPAFYEKERTNVFGKEWLLFARNDQLRTPGSYVSDIIAGHPIFVVRKNNGELGAFFNVCPHRANQILPFESTGQCSVLRCKYHGWAFDTNGKLKSTPNVTEEISPELKQQLNLRPVRVESWRGLIFINLDMDAKPLQERFADIDRFINGKIPELETKSFGDYHLATDKQHAMDVNWKLYVENYQEGYHIQFIHPLLTDMYQCSEYKVTDYPAGRFSVHHVPQRDNSGVAEAKDFDPEAVWLWIYPNLALNIYSSQVMNVERILPQNHRKTVLHYWFLASTAEKAAEMKAAEDSAAKKSANENVSDIVTQEDIEVVNQLQRNLESGAFVPRFISPSQENGVLFFQRLLQESMSK